MRWLLLVLCGCNQVYGVGNVVGRDAQVFDAPVDAQPFCPAFGVVPRFSPIVQEVIDQPCGGYTTSATADLALALCETVIDEGPIDHALATKSVGFAPPDATHDRLWVRLSPDGDEAYVEMFDFDQIGSVVQSYTRSNGTWVRGADVASSVMGGASTPSRGPGAHLLVFDRQTTMIKELVRSSGSWSPVRTFDVGVIPYNIWLGADGLRALVVATAPTSKIVYIDRAHIDDAFEPPVAVPSLPPVDNVFVTDDCTRVYLSDVGAVFYAAQI